MTELSEYDWDAQETYIEIERIAPMSTKDGVSCSGVLPGRIYKPIDINYLAENYGGRRYALHVSGPDKNTGRIVRYKTINNVNVAAGEPKLNSNGMPKGPAEPAITPQDLSMSSGPAIERLADRMVTQASRTAEESRRAALDAENRLHAEKQRILDERLEEVRQQQAGGTGALEVLQRQAAEQTRAQTEMLQLLAQRSNSEQDRQLTMFQTMLAALAAQKPVAAPDNSMADTWREELRSTRDAHVQQLAAIREEHRDRLEAIRAEYERAGREADRLHNLQIEALKKQVESLERDVREAREAERKLRDDLHTSRAEALEAKLKATLGDRDINNTLETVAKAKSLVAVFGGSTEPKAEEGVVDRLFNFVSSDTGSNLINSIGSRLKAQVEKRQEAPALPPAPAPDYQSMAAWQEWQQRHTLHGQPQLPQKPTMGGRAGGPPRPRQRPVVPPQNANAPYRVPGAQGLPPPMPEPAPAPAPEPPAPPIVDQIAQPPVPRVEEPGDAAVRSMLNQLATFLENASGTGADPSATYTELLPQLDVVGVDRSVLEKATADDVLALFDNVGVALSMPVRAYVRAMLASRQVTQ